jgi:putative NIF3 family GTP cyclohydrolase 1 type 2
VWLSQSQPALIMQAVSALPEPLAKVVRPGANALIVHLAPWRDGMRWIEVGDPRLRKTDKLRQASR